MLNIQDLSVKRKGFELSIDSLKIENTNLCLVVAPNGGGKTTLLKSMAGLVHYKGDIFLDGSNANLLAFKLRARLFAYLPQHIYLPEFNVKDFLITGRFPYTGTLSYYNSEDWDKVNTVAKSVDILKYMDRDLASLSQGELQRVMLAKVFIQSPKILLLDEPTNALDIGFKELICEQIYKYIDSNPGSLVVISTHEPEFFSRKPNKTLMIKDGKVFKFGDFKSVYTEDNKKVLFNLV